MATASNDGHGDFTRVRNSLATHEALFQKMRAAGDQLGNIAAESMGTASPQKVNRNHGNNPVNNLSQG